MAGTGGPLGGLRVVEVASIGPGPFAAMMLADMGAEVLRVDRAFAAANRPRGAAGPPQEPMLRGRRSVGVDLKHPDGPGVVLRLAERADALLEGFRPGVAERLGIGPEQCFAQNARLVYGRMTGWGQDGPLAKVPGHDINYIALAGALEPIGRAGGAPVPPLNLLGDFGGGGMFLAFGVVCALLEARESGRGQVVDAAMVDGAASLMTMTRGLAAAGTWSAERGTNLLDTGAPFYDVYETADGRFVSIGPLEPQFYAELVRLLGDEAAGLAEGQMDRSRWPERKELLRKLFATRTRDEWCALLEGTDACFAPVLSMEEAPSHPHNRARETFVEVGGVVQAAPAPRLSRTPGGIRRPPPWPGEHTVEALGDWGFTEAEVAELTASGAVV